MRRLIGAVFLCGLAATALHAQTSPYVPSTELPNGRQIMAVYIGGQNCGACLNPLVKEAVVQMKSLVALQARQTGASFAAIGVADDWDQSVAASFIASVGPFDQVVLGGSFTNLAIELFVWRDHEGQALLPQIVIVERSVLTEGPRITFSEPRFLRRIFGADSIPAWVRDGAPISAVSKP